ncbi:unnamed protein product, partial [Rotaria sp. Silwood1]
MSTSFNIIDTANCRFEELFNADKLDELVNLFTLGCGINDQLLLLLFTMINSDRAGIGIDVI